MLSCNVVKRVGENEHLLTENNVYVNGKKSKAEEINKRLYQRPNSDLFGFPLQLHIYNLARPKRDSLFEAWLDEKPNRRERLKNIYSQKQVDQLKSAALGFNRWLRKTGEAPVIIDSTRTAKSKTNLERYFFGNGWFDREVTYEMTKNDNKRGTVSYYIDTGEPYHLDTITTKISSPIIDSIYQLKKNESNIKPGEQFNNLNFENERNRLTDNFRNSGVYHFAQDYINFEIDTIGKNNMANVELQIGDREIRTADSVVKKPFKIYKIREVNIITDDTYDNNDASFQDSLTYKNYNLYSYDDIRYRAKAITDAIFINKNSLYSDLDRKRTYRYLNELKTFRYPNIDYIENVEDTTLTANIYLAPRKKYGLGFEFNVSQSNIQVIGFAFSTSLIARNVFRGAETLELSALGSIGASKDGTNSKDSFFDINETGADLKLTIPRLFLPFNTEKIVPKYMSPTSRLSLGFTSQTNIGLDKQTVNGIINYRWYPSDRVTHGVDLLNAQYVRNLNPENYFNVYGNSYDRLNDIAMDDYNTPPEFLDDNGDLIIDEADDFMALVLADESFEVSNPDDYQSVSNINERKDRLTENNLIIASNFTYTLDKRQSLFDEDFSIFKFKIELAGNLLSNIANLAGLEKNDDGRYEIFNVAYSQYIKTEFDYIKHWDLGRKNVFAIRNFFGIAIPYGNSTSIPFSKSFFAGGTNDNRAWTAYDLGPGSSDSNNEFNEANMKIALSAEYRYNIAGALNGAFFIDAGNIWNVLDSEEDPRATFTGLASLKDIAIGSGFGVRYDFGFFVLRGDVGFKTYDPSREIGNRWFKDYNFSNAVYNIGINYPF